MEHSDATRIRDLNWGEAPTITLTSRGIKTVADIRRLGVEGLAAKGISSFLLTLCEDLILGKVVEEINETLPPEAPASKKTRTKRAPITVVCGMGHVEERPQSPHTYRPCATCGASTSKQK